MSYIEGLVSTIIPTYKRSEKLGRAIRSALEQSYRNIEVLVVSDNEPDDEYTAEAQRVVDSFGDDRVRLITQEHHKNGAAARNAGIRAAKGEYVAFLDDDDYWERRKIELQVKLLSSLDESWGAVTCKNKAYVNGKLVAAQTPIKDGWVCKGILSRTTSVSTDTILLRHISLDESGYFDENLRRHQEVQMMGMFAFKYKIKLLDMYLVCVDSSTNENQPDADRMSVIKQEFLQAVKPVLDKLPKKDVKDIKIMNRFELGGLYFKTGHKKKGIKLMMGVFKSPRTIFCAINLLIRKFACQAFAKRRVQKDNYTIMEKMPMV